MKFFVDTADVEEVKAARDLGLADGVTTNPTLIQKSGKPFRETVIAMAALVQGPVNAEAVSTDRDGIIREGREMARWAPNVAVKIPITREGLQAVKVLESEDIRTTVTLVFTPVQALLAAKAGASWICPFVGRLDDISTPGMEIIGQILRIYGQYSELKTEVIVASVRTPVHVLEAALLGAHGVTIPFPVIQQMVRHPLTDQGIQKFMDDWKKTK